MLDVVASRDTALLAALRRDLDANVFQDILAALGEELARRRCSVRTEGREWHALREDVQATLSLAATFGFGRLADLSRAVLASRSCSAHGFPDLLYWYSGEMQRLLAWAAIASRRLPTRQTTLLPIR